MSGVKFNIPMFFLLLLNSKLDGPAIYIFPRSASLLLHICFLPSLVHVFLSRSSPHAASLQQSPGRISQQTTNRTTSPVHRRFQQMFFPSPSRIKRSTEDIFSSLHQHQTSKTSSFLLYAFLKVSSLRSVCTHFKRNFLQSASFSRDNATWRQQTNLLN